MSQSTGEMQNNLAATAAGSLSGASESKNERQKMETASAQALEDSKQGVISSRIE